MSAIALSAHDRTIQEADSFSIRLGTVLGRERPTVLWPSEDVFRTHMAILGGTRQGKSKLFEHIVRQLITNGRGVALIDPHSDTADDVFAYLAQNYEQLGFARKNIHYLNPNERLFAFDPFEYHPFPDDPLGHTEFSYRCWLDTKIKGMIRMIIRQQGETEEESQKMVRLKRWLYNVLYAVGVRHDASGTHLPLSDAFILLNPQHDRHEQLYSTVAPLLSDTVRADFEKLRRTKDPRRQEDWTESTFNRLRDVLSPIMDQIFHLEAPTINFREIIQRNGIILASLGKTTHFDKDSALAIAGLLILEISEAAQTTVDREDRNQFYLLIDEAHNFLGEDLDRMFVESAKFKISLGLAVQDLAKLKKGQLDLVPTVLSQAGIRITFQQQYQEHAEILAKSLCYRNLDFEPLLHEVDRPDGYDWVVTASRSFGESTGHGKTYGHSTTESTTTTDTESKSHTEASNWSQANNWAENEGQSLQLSGGRSRENTIGFSNGESSLHTEGASTSRAKTNSTQEGHSENDSSLETSGQSLGTGRSVALPNGRIVTVENQGRATGSSLGHSSGSSTSRGTSESEGHSTQASDGYGSTRAWSKSQSDGETDSASVGVQAGSSHGATDGRGGSVANTAGSSVGKAHGIAMGKQWSESESRGRNQSVSYTPTPLVKHRQEVQETGRLRRSVPDQIARFTQGIMALHKQHCLVSIASGDFAVDIRVDDVHDPFDLNGVSQMWRKRTIDHVKDLIFAMHSYYFNPPLAGDREQPKVDSPGNGQPQDHLNTGKQKSNGQPTAEGGKRVDIV